jgi:hypothetical protein
MLRPDDGMRAVLYNIRSIYSAPRAEWLCEMGSESSKNILSAVKCNPTCKIKIKCHGPTMALGLCCITFEVFILCPTGRVVVQNGLRARKTY